MPESSCSGCGLRFTGVTTFDRHHQSTSEPPHVRCLDPRDVGLEVKIRKRGGRRREVWGYPSDDDEPWSHAHA